MRMPHTSPKGIRGKKILDEWVKDLKPTHQILIFKYFDELGSKKLLQPTYQKRAPKLVSLSLSPNILRSLTKW